MCVIKARTHGCVRNVSEMHSTGVTGLHSRQSCSPVTQSRAFHCHFPHTHTFSLYHHPREVRNSINRHRKIYIDYRSKFSYRFILMISIIYGNITCYILIQWGLVAFSWEQFHRKHSIYLWLVWVWKLQIWDYSCIRHGAMTGVNSLSGSMQKLLDK